MHLRLLVDTTLLLIHTIVSLTHLGGLLEHLLDLTFELHVQADTLLLPRQLQLSAAVSESLPELLLDVLHRTLPLEEVDAAPALRVERAVLEELRAEELGAQLPLRLRAE